jgi:hypothetical protein
VLVLLTGGIYEVRRSHDLGWNDVHNKFHNNWLKHSNVVKGDTTDCSKEKLFSEILSSRGVNYCINIAVIWDVTSCNLISF